MKDFDCWVLPKYPTFVIFDKKGTIMILNTDIAAEFTQKHNLPAPLFMKGEPERFSDRYIYRFIIPLAQDTGDIYYCLSFYRTEEKEKWKTAEEMEFDVCHSDNKYHRGHGEWAVTVERLKMPLTNLSDLRFGYNRVYITSMSRYLGKNDTLEGCLSCIDDYRRRKANEQKLQKRFEIRSASVPDFTEDFQKVVDKYQWKAKVLYFKSTDHKDAQPYRYHIEFGLTTFKEIRIMIGINKSLDEFELSLSFPGDSQLFGNIRNTFLLKGDSFGTMNTIEKCCEGLDVVMKYLADLLVAGDVLRQRIISLKSSQE
jgi:hypothetical protein